MQKQLMFEFPLPRIHGGARKGAGRNRQGKRAKVTHMARQPFGKTRVLHVTCRVAEGLPGLRDRKTARLVMDYLAGHCEKVGFRVVEYSIQGNHVHLVCEATGNEALSKAMNGLLSGLARVLNRDWGRRGKVFEDRYHAEILETPRQCRNVLLYVLHNAKKHGSRSPRSGADPYSTAPWFPFTSCASHRTDTKPAANPRTWLLKIGWRKCGPIHLHDQPRLPTKPTRLPALSPSKIPSPTEPVGGSAAVTTPQQSQSQSAPSRTTSPNRTISIQNARKRAWPIIERYCRALPVSLTGQRYR